MNFSKFSTSIKYIQWYSYIYIYNTYVYFIALLLYMYKQD